METEDGGSMTKEVVFSEDPVEETQKKCVHRTGVKYLRMVLNLFTNSLIFVTVFVCLAYACRGKLTMRNVHIIGCVLGYQFFMSQALMALSNFNGCTVLLGTDGKYHVNWVLQLIGVGLVVAGSVLYVLDLKAHFTTTHGASGMVAALASVITFIAGIIAFLVTKYCANAKVKMGFQIFHVVISVITLVLAAISLGFAFEDVDFKNWLSRWFNDDDLPAPVLQLMTGLFTFLVVVDASIPNEKVQQ